MRAVALASILEVPDLNAVIAEQEAFLIEIRAPFLDAFRRLALRVTKEPSSRSRNG